MQIEVWCTTFHRRLDGGQTSDRDSQVWLWEAAGRAARGDRTSPRSLHVPVNGLFGTAKAIEKAKIAITARSGRIMPCYFRPECLSVAKTAPILRKVADISTVIPHGYETTMIRGLLHVLTLLLILCLCNGDAQTRAPSLSATPSDEKPG